MTLSTVSDNINDQAEFNFDTDKSAMCTDNGLQITLIQLQLTVAQLNPGRTLIIIELKSITTITLKH